MPELSTALFITQCTRILKEAFEGPPGPWSYFTDRAPAPGLLGSISKLGAEAVSRPAGTGASTIAGHVQHLVLTLELYRQWISGAAEARSRDRSHTWTVKAVDDRAWAELQRRLRQEYEGLVVSIETRRDWNEETLGGALGAMTHVAYHLGAIRQRIALLGTTSRP